MRKMVLFRMFCFYLLLLLGLSLLRNSTPQPFIPEVNGSPYMLPIDGDAWTENDNATYPWKCSPSYPDDIQFVTEDKKVGSYSLRVNHTLATTYMGFFLDISATTNFSGYDLFVFWFKMVNVTAYGGKPILSISNGPYIGPYKRISWGFLKNAWVKAVMPLEAFYDYGGTPSWATMRYFHFSIPSLSSGDGTKVYIDGMHFSTWADISETATVDETMLPNFDSFIHRWEKTQTYLGIDYTSLYSMIPVSGSYFSYEELESETLGQTIYALMIAYDYSNSQYYLDFAKPYVNWLLKFQYLNQSSQGHGGFVKKYMGGDSWSNVISPRNGWILGALSLYYSFTSNSTVKTAIELLRGYIIDTLWDNTNDWFDYGFDTSTQTVTQSSYWLGMDQGCYAVGLTLYYKYISQNSTVKDCLDQQLNNGLGLSQQNEFYRGTDQYEDSIYAWWGYYWAYKAFSNSTYYNEALKAIKLTRANYEHNLNGSVFFNVYLINTTTGFDGWGFACSLPLLFMLYEHEQDSNYLELFENQLLDLTVTIKTGNYSITRKRGSGDVWVNWQYIPSNAFIVAALTMYYARIYEQQNPYLISTNKEITSLSFAGETLTFEVNASSGETSSTKIYCGDKGEPREVFASNGSFSWSYDVSSMILEVIVSQLGPSEVIVDWRMLGDVNGDDVVDIFDAAKISAHWYPGPPIGPLGYDLIADINYDGAVDILDAGIVSAHWTGPPKGPLAP